MKQIQLGTKEFYDLMEFFEKTAMVRGDRTREQDKELWKIGQYYQNGAVNSAFTIFLSGVNFGVSLC